MTAQGLDHLAELCRDAAAYTEATDGPFLGFVLGAALRLGAVAAAQLA